MNWAIDSDGLTLPLDIRNVGIVDDAGGTHFECQMTAAYLVDLYRSGLLTLTGNIRPEHNRDHVTGKTKMKIQKWTRELLDNDAIIGNISVRLNPDHSEYEVWNDEETGDTCLTIRDGVLDCAVDSLSRIKAILSAAENPLASFNLDTRFQVRVWLLSDTEAKKVATIYNTRGDKVNDSTAKYAYSETQEQELARRLVNQSPHLGQDNVEVLSNSVSASSHKLTAFNTISKAIESFWKGGPVTAADLDEQSKWLLGAWDALVTVRPEFGKVSTPARQNYRRDSISSTSIAIFGLIGAMSVMYAEGVDPREVLPRLKQSAGPDIFAIDNPIWRDAGVVTPSGKVGKFTTRNSFPARRAATRILRSVMGLSPEGGD
jgi:hypothetical protein